MLRPILAFLTLCLAAFLLAPTVASVHEKVEELHVDRPLPWQLWKWDDIDTPPPLSGCGKEQRQLYSEVTKWPERIQKDETFTLGGVVQSEETGRTGVREINVDLFLNETKSEPGVFLGEAVSDAEGKFTLRASIPFDLEATRYHLVAHAKEERIDCIRYLEHWSDPEMDVLSETSIRWDDPGPLVVGRSATLSGRLLDAVGAPVRNANLTFIVDGETHDVRTNGRGAFSIPYTPGSPGELEATAEYEGSEYYAATKGASIWQVLEEDLDLDREPAFLRSEPLLVQGHVYVADDKAEPEVLLAFHGLRVVACEGCAPTEEVRVPVGADGTFEANLTVPSTEAPGDYKLTATGGGLDDAYSFNATVKIPAKLVLSARSPGLFSKGYEGNVTLTDEVGAPIVAPIILAAEGAELTNSTDANGVYAFSGAFSECGTYPLKAIYEGDEHITSARQTQDVTACAYLSYIPPWLLAVPWWVWPLALLGALAAWQIARAWRQNYATVIIGGPALTLTFTEPRDDAVGYAGIGEVVLATAFLEEPLPDGHRLRMGTHRSTREVPLDAELRAHLRLEPEKLGELPVRAEIVDAKGRIVSRRTLTLHVVEYAREIERRYLRLRTESGAEESVTPREFERWLHERAPGLDPELSRRLIRIFEEADYSPRVAGRAELAAYLAAEGGVKEVTTDALA